MGPYSPGTMLAKALVDVMGVGGSIAAAILAEGESQPLTYGALGATLVFTGLLVRQITANQKVYVAIVAGKDYELELVRWSHRRDIWDLESRLHESRWEAERLRFTYGERPIDPGPYVPRKRPTDLDTPPPRHPTTGAPAT